MTPHDPRIVGSNAGTMNRLTGAIRGRRPLTDSERRRVKRLRQMGWSFQRLAVEFLTTERVIRHALATVRTPRDDPPRGTLNVSIAARDHIRKLRHAGEPMWVTVNRLLGL